MAPAARLDPPLRGPTFLDAYGTGRRTQAPVDEIVPIYSRGFVATGMSESCVMPETGGNHQLAVRSEGGEE